MNDASEHEMNWQIIGAGAIGSLCAAKLLLSGQRVRLITRRPVAQQRLSFRDNNDQQHQLACPIETQLIASQDPILVCVKAPQVAEALRVHLDMISPEQAIILLHNGMGCAEQVQTLLPNNPIICATTANACLVHKPLQVQHTGLGVTYLGPFNAAATQHAHLATSLQAALTDCHWDQQISEKLWLKLIINIAINPLTALHQVNNGALSSPVFQQQIDTLLDEMMPLVARLGLPYQRSMLQRTINQVIHATAQNFSSMNRDIYWQRPTEIDFINGYLLQQAARYDMAMPLLESLYQQVKQRQAQE